MASYAHWDAKGARYVLGPPVIPAQENHPPRETWNPTFELEYWDHALGDRAALASSAPVFRRSPSGTRSARNSPPCPSKTVCTWRTRTVRRPTLERNRDHPSMLGALGVLPGRKVDRETMRRTLKKVFAEWKWEDTWGWDFPMVAMTAASLKEPAMAIDALCDADAEEYLAAQRTQLAAGESSALPAREWRPAAGHRAHGAGKIAFPGTGRYGTKDFRRGVRLRLRRNLYVPNQRLSPTSHMRAVAGYDAANFLCNIRCCLRRRNRR